MADGRLRNNRYCADKRYRKRTKRTDVEIVSDSSSSSSSSESFYEASSSDHDRVTKHELEAVKKPSDATQAKELGSEVTVESEQFELSAELEFPKLVNSSDESGVEETGSESVTIDCAICLQTCVHPARLPCGHIFCFLCLKGIAHQSKRCAMCRQEIPADYLEHPDLVPSTSTATAQQSLEGGYQWFYEGHNGWWQYDERTSRELEAAYKAGDRTCELLIAGFLYIADFEAMVQMRRHEPARRRHIKRDLATVPKKGIAGIKQYGDNILDSITHQISALSVNDHVPLSYSLPLGPSDNISE